jgi:formylglycine-generating enzyme required for sulfatase activity
VASGTTSGTAVYGQSFATGPAEITNAGGLSPYGTMAQNGNVWEWGESGFTAPNDSAGESRLIRGGGWASNSGSLASSLRSSPAPRTRTPSCGSASQLFLSRLLS